LQIVSSFLRFLLFVDTVTGWWCSVVLLRAALL